jgi:3-hydroxyacyl-[acyl-carrier-protein] dehydratase
MAQAGDTACIESLIPHRAPFLFIDSIRVLQVGVRCASEWRVRHEEPGLAGHFPGYPILPGVLLVEHVAQTACLLIGPLAAESAGRLPLLAKIEACSFHASVFPGDIVHTDVRLERRLGEFTVCRGVSRVEERLVLRCQLVIALATSKQPI